ncbi:MAG: aminotransferase class III-fold pyridoxal phosphate-dependent enzyme [Candidatus Obscuribacterales bacterium]|nr:aminotransferase class III-fold pyridoxal phosphate-dependent enzyme [Candidatus Obscuribacterales bacterium]
MSAVKEDMNKTLLERGAKHVSATNARAFDIVASHGKGSYLWDVNGTRYLDFTSGIAVNNVGHCHPDVVAAISEQAKKLIHVAMVASNEPLIRLAEKLAELAPGNLDTVFLNNSGGEAIDAAIKMARFVSKRSNIIAFTGAFHGRTLLGTALTAAKSHYRDGFEPLPAGIHHISYPYCYRCPVGQKAGSCKLECFDLVEKAFKHFVKPESVAAIILEPQMGEGGYVPLASGYSGKDGYMQRLRELCDKHGILLIVDEVQTGFGRTGEWFAVNHWNVVPDIMVVAKGIASGMPMAGVISRAELMKKWLPGKHGSTYGGNPVACSAALASINVIEKENLLQNARTLGAYLTERVKSMAQKYKFIGDVRGFGLMLGIEFVDAAGMPDGERLSRLVDECEKRRLLLLDCGPSDHVVRFLPPLNVSKEELDEGLSIFEEALSVL